MVLFFI